MTRLPMKKTSESLLLQKELSILHDEFSAKTENVVRRWFMGNISRWLHSHQRSELCHWLSAKAPQTRAGKLISFEIDELADGLALATYWAKMTAPKTSESKGAYA